MRVMITGGGTGGHTSPALAIVEELQRRDPRLLLQWVGRKGGIEERLCKARAIPFRSVPVEGWPRRRTPRKAWVAAKLALGIGKSALLLRKFDAQVVVGVGGYVSLPLMWAAQRMGVPTVLHEQNRQLGMANRMVAPRATRVFLSYPDTQGDYPEAVAQVVGNPIRAEFAEPPSRTGARAALGIDLNLPTLLVVGGSQGAQSINRAVTNALPVLEPNELQVIWMTGKAGEDQARQAAAKMPVPVHVFPFIEDMVSAYAAADLIVNRAGASSTAEIAQMGKPAILVPYPGADNHQEHNARAFEEVGGGVLLLDAECSGRALVSLIRDLFAEPSRLTAMGEAARTLARPGAAEAIVEEILSLVFETGEAGGVS
jgi:UDP-N-acetylglucosamine--N-acetylmuramyl-(pentapeptide) pyrophosphoryl-undecaprenol N-acetylglucosamine transferase